MAVLCRTNARTTEFEEALHEAAIPFQGSSLLERDAARRLLKTLKETGRTDVAATVRGVAEEHGLVTGELPEKLGERELVRQQDLARLVRLAETFDDGERRVANWIEDLHARFGPTAGAGVHLLTLHRAKGLEWDAVFLPRIEEKELPIKLARTPEEIAEERRLLYVGITRARRWLHLTWSGKPCRFLTELGVSTAPVQRPKPRVEDLPPAFVTLREWRRERARADDVPAYVVFHDTTLAEIATRQPRTIAELAAVSGVGPTKLERYGEEVLRALAG
jgi:DNA helicase-2/ATP-dependent DNA helicase PcrA